MRIDVRFSFRRALSVIAVVIAVCATTLVPLNASQVQFPRPKKEERDAQKNLTGQVVDKGGKGLREAIVYLKDKKSLQTTTRITDDKGGYKFSGLDANSDYEVHAEFNSASSSKRNVSSFDDRKELYLVLEIGAQ